MSDTTSLDEFLRKRQACSEWLDDYTRLRVSNQNLMEFMGHRPVLRPALYMLNPHLSEEDVNNLTVKRMQSHREQCEAHDRTLDMMKAERDKLERKVFAGVSSL